MYKLARLSDWFPSRGLIDTRILPTGKQNHIPALTSVMLLPDPPLISVIPLMPRC